MLVPTLARWFTSTWTTLHKLLNLQVISVQVEYLVEVLVQHAPHLVEVLVMPPAHGDVLQTTASLVDTQLAVVPDQDVALLYLHPPPDILHVGIGLETFLTKHNGGLGEAANGEGVPYLWQEEPEVGSRIYIETTPAMPRCNGNEMADVAMRDLVF